MKTTVDLPDDLLRQAKATAALAGETLRELVATALREHLERHSSLASSPRGWRAVFGCASQAEVDEVDAAITAELGQIDPEEWR